MCLLEDVISVTVNLHNLIFILSLLTSLREEELPFVFM